MITTPGDSEAYLAEVRAFAKSVGADEQFESMIKYLDGYANDTGHTPKTRCELSRDGAPYSFGFVMYGVDAKGANPKYWFNGGLIYSGPGQPADGSGPAFSVSLDPDAASGKVHKWSIHT